MKTLILALTLILAPLAHADGFGINLGLGVEVSNDKWLVESPIATIELIYEERSWFVAFEHQSLLTEGWPLNHRGEVTIDELRYGRRTWVSDRLFFDVSVGKEMLDQIDSAIITLDIGYQVKGWVISLESKSLSSNLASPVSQIRLMRRF